MKYIIRIKNLFVLFIALVLVFNNCTQDEKSSMIEQRIAEQKPKEKNILRVMNATARIGDSEIVVSLYLSNSVDVAGLEVKLNYDPEVLTPEELKPIDRAYGFNLYRGNIVEPGSYKILLVDFMGKALEPGEGEILTVTFSISDRAEPGTFPLMLSEMNVSNRQGKNVDEIKAGNGELELK